MTELTKRFQPDTEVIWGWMLGFNSGETSVTPKAYHHAETGCQDHAAS